MSRDSGSDQMESETTSTPVVYKEEDLETIYLAGGGF